MVKQNLTLLSRLRNATGTYITLLTLSDLPFDAVRDLLPTEQVLQVLGTYHIICFLCPSVQVYLIKGTPEALLEVAKYISNVVLGNSPQMPSLKGLTSKKKKDTTEAITSKKEEGPCEETGKTSKASGENATKGILPILNVRILVPPLFGNLVCQPNFPWGKFCGLNCCVCNRCIRIMLLRTYYN